jgi:hypothetical protein
MSRIWIDCGGNTLVYHGPWITEDYGGDCMIRPKPRKKRSKRDLTGRNSAKAGWSVALAVLAMVVIGATVFVFRQRAGLPPGRLPNWVPPYYQSVERARPFPHTVSPKRFAEGPVIRAYELAQQIPEILVQQPCYCGCNRLGHRSLLHCFTSDHGADCTVCLKEILLADRLVREGKGAEYVRASIIAGEWWQIRVK